MKLPTSTIIHYKNIHSWVGIVCGLLLFTAFYAGAVTMFEAPLQRWLTPSTALPPPPPLADTARLIQETFKYHPEARREFAIYLKTDATNPARLTWTVHNKAEQRDHNHEGGNRFGASFDTRGKLVVEKLRPSSTAQFIDTLHQQAGLPFDHDFSMYIVGAVCLLYVLALVSGLIVLLPSLAKGLFALRLDKAFKRRWLDIHNVLGLFSMPFHIVMALTALVFALHDVFYDVQDVALYGGKLQSMWERPKLVAANPRTPLMHPDGIVAKLAQSAPGFVPVRLEYRAVKPGKLTLNVWGHDDRYGVRGPMEGFAGVDPYRGTLLQADYLPGHQDGWLATVTAFFALHFGNYGGLPVRWSYVALGLAGAFMFYTGNILWVDARRRRNSGIDTVSTWALAHLTLGWTLGTVAGISIILVVTKLIGPDFGENSAAIVFYGTLAAAIFWAFLRGEKKAKAELAWCACMATACVPVALGLA